MTDVSTDISPAQAYRDFASAWHSYSSGKIAWAEVYQAYGLVRALLTPDERKVLWAETKRIEGDPVNALYPLWAFGKERQRLYHGSKARKEYETRRASTPRRKAQIVAAHKRQAEKRRLSKKDKEAPND